MTTFLKQILICMPLLWACSPKQEPLPTIIIGNSAISTIDERLFGQFLEKPSWHGEHGPEAALAPGSSELQEGVLELMKEMNIPVLRFPGGTDVNQHDWTTTIDNVPGRAGGRPDFVGQRGDTVTQRFGYDEALRLAEELGAEMIIVPNFGDAYFKRKPLQEAVMHEMGLIAYCNLPVGSKLPEGMPDWPAIRAKNGHPEPYNVRYVQIANEPWVLDRQLKMQGEIEPERKQQYLDVVQAFVDAIELIDPSIEIIVDGNSEQITTPLPGMFGDRIDYIAYHTYMPWGINEVQKDGEPFPIDSLTDEQKWLGWVSIPRFNDQGLSAAVDPSFERLRQMDYPIAVTEWNWNGWWGNNSVDPDKMGEEFTKGVGAAGYLHAFMREGDAIKIGIQSMLVGNSWGIMAIRVSPEGSFEPHPLPTGMVTSLYSNHHGSNLLEVSSERLPMYHQPFKMSGIAPADSVAYIDAVATGNAGEVFLHVINRHFTDDITCAIDLSAWTLGSTEATMWSMVPNDGCDTRERVSACIRESTVALDDNNLKITFPSRSVSVVRLKVQ
jgi:alpha-N-arabinofuranosidase